MTDDFFDETCGGCLWFKLNPPQDPPVAGGASQGTCWRYPPTPLSIPVPAASGAIQVPKGREGAAQGASQGIMTLPVRAPVARETLACGEWEAPDDGNGDATPGDAA
ncbi:MAG: hypothetical protein GTN49_10750 [candidate division Zixibacteria bacterium]|nr:hypothetical protein [candidate division Zixibacteria bacterium]